MLASTDYPTVLGDHTTLACRSVDRFFLQRDVPNLESVVQVYRLAGPVPDPFVGGVRQGPRKERPPPR